MDEESLANMVSDTLYKKIELPRLHDVPQRKYISENEQIKQYYRDRDEVPVTPQHVLEAIHILSQKIDKMEEIITRPLEDVVSTVGGIVRLFSVSEAGKSRINIEFAREADSIF